MEPLNEPPLKKIRTEFGESAIETNDDGTNGEETVLENWISSGGEFKTEIEGELASEQDCGIIAYLDPNRPSFDALFKQR
jgi:hypothetical protein